MKPIASPAVSPVWTPRWSRTLLLEAGGEEARARVKKALQWLAPLQILDVKGDWARSGPTSRPAAGRSNTPTPIIPMSTTPPSSSPRWTVFPRDRRRAPWRTYARARIWVEGLQSKNGGWGAFDADNCHYHLNHIPFADHGALLDPPTADVSARCVSMLRSLGDTPESSERLARGVDYLLAEQMADGSCSGVGARITFTARGRRCAR